MSKNQTISDYIDDLATVLNDGGNEPFIVTYDTEEYGIDKDFDEIVSAYNSGKPLFGKLSTGNELLPLSGIIVNSDNAPTYFEFVYVDSTMQYIALEINNHGDYSTVQGTITTTT